MVDIRRRGFKKISAFSIKPFIWSRNWNMKSEFTGPDCRVVRAFCAWNFTLIDRFCRFNRTAANDVIEEAGRAIISNPFCFRGGQQLKTEV
jgi:hypothetical protein